MTTSLARISGLQLVISLNLDRMLYAVSILVALGFGAWLGSIVFPG